MFDDVVGLNGTDTGGPFDDADDESKRLVVHEAVSQTGVRVSGTVGAKNPFIPSKNLPKRVDFTNSNLLEVDLSEAQHLRELRGKQLPLKGPT